MALPQLEVLWTARYDYPANWTVDEHRHDFHQLICFQSGRAVFRNGNQERELHGGALTLILPGSWHHLRALSHLRTLDIKFRVPDAALRSRLSNSHLFYETHVGDAVDLLDRIRWEGEHRKPLFRELCATYLLQLLIQLIREKFEAHGADDPVAFEAAGHDEVCSRAVAFMVRNLSKPISQGQVAKEAGFTERHVRARFHSVCGMSPSDYLQSLRVKEAKALLTSNELPLKEIAVRTGFQTVQHFTRVFRKQTGSTPGAWRDAEALGIRRDVYIDPGFSNAIFTRSAQGLPIQTKAIPAERKSSASRNRRTGESY